MGNDENRRLREETTLTPDKSILDSKEKQIKKLGEKIRTLEKDYDEALNLKDEQKMKADRLEREKQPLANKIESLENDLKHALKMADTTDGKMSKDIAMFNQEIARLLANQEKMSTGMEKGQKEILECKENEIKKLLGKVESLEGDVSKMKSEKESLEKEKVQLKKDLDLEKDLLKKAVSENNTA